MVQKSLGLFNRARHKSARSLALKPDSFGFESLWTTMFSSKPQVLRRQAIHPIIILFLFKEVTLLSIVVLSNFVLSFP